MTFHVLPSLMGPSLLQVLPLSGVRSKWTRHPLLSVLEGQNKDAPTCTGLFLMGPSTPSGNAWGALQVKPWSEEVFIQPVQPATLGPIL